MSTTASIANWYLPERKPLRNAVLRALGELLFCLIVLQVVTGIYLQAQLALFDGRILVPNGIPKMLLVIGIGIWAACGLLRKRGQVTLRACLLPTCIFACYLVADLLWLAVTSGLPNNALLLGFNKYYLFFAAIPAAAILHPRFSENRIQFRLSVLLLPLVAVALAQYVMNDPLMPIAAEDGSHVIPAVDFFDQVRAFSLFRGVLDCGQGMAFFGALMLARILSSDRRHPAWNLVLLALAAATCLVTFRRGSYLEFGAASVSAIAISRKWVFVRWLPWIYLAFGIALAIVGPLLINSVQGESMFSSESLIERHDIWTSTLNKWLLREDASLLFGTGLSQTESEEIEPYLVDNGFLAVGVQLGLVGLALWFWVMQSLWRDMLATAQQTGSTLAIAVAALLSTWMMRDIFDPVFALYPLYAFMVFWSQRDAARTKPASLSSRQAVPCA